MLWKIATNALHTIAITQRDTNLILEKIKDEMAAHSQRDADANKSTLEVLGLIRDTLIRLDERTRNDG